MRRGWKYMMGRVDTGGEGRRQSKFRYARDKLGTYRSNRGFPPGEGSFCLCCNRSLSGETHDPTRGIIFFSTLPRGESTPGGMCTN